MADSPWPMIHAERRALLADAESFTPEQWETQSLCDEWTIRQAFGHVTSSARQTPLRFFKNFTASGFNFSKMLDADIARETAVSTADQIESLRGLLDATTSPPGPVDAMLGENVVHAADIRHPLGIHRDVPIATLVRVANFYKGSNLLIGSKSRIAGVKLKATDADWSTGSGPEVRGPALSLVMVMTGRMSALADLSGDGIGILQAR